MSHFDPSTAPWVDREDFAEQATRRADAGELDENARQQLDSWRQNGFLSLPAAIEPQLVDQLLAEYEDIWQQRPPLKALVEGKGVQDLPEVEPREKLTHHHFRILDIQDASPTARQVMFHPTIIDAVGRIFDQPPVAMQSLFFEYGSEQGIHQDFPYVSAGILSHLVGCWIALEDVDDDNGPLFYYPGSHRLPLFDWGGGSLTFDGKDHSQVDAFGEYLQAASAEAGLEKTVMHARKGDVLLWHASLAHGGSPVDDPQRSRKSFVVHFSTRQAYPVDRRWPDREPTVEQIGGGYLYSEPTNPPAGLLRRARWKLGRWLGR